MAGRKVFSRIRWIRVEVTLFKKVSLLAWHLGLPLAQFLREISLGFDFNLSR